MRSIFLKKFKKSIILLSGLLLLTACDYRNGKTVHEKQMQQLTKLKKAADNNPAMHKVDYVYQQQQNINKRLTLADQARLKGDLETALINYQQVVEIDSQNVVAKEGISKLKQLDQVRSLYELAKQAYQNDQLDAALIILKEVIQTAPDLQEAIDLRFEIDRALNRQKLSPPQVTERLNQRVSLEFRSAPIQAVMELLSQNSGINFIVDRDTKLDQIPVTIYAKNTTVQEALDMMMRTSSINYKVLNANTFLIYQDSPEKRKIYDEMITKSFYLGSADPQRAQEMISKLYDPKAMFFDARLRMLIVRDNQNVIDSIDKVLQAFDLPMPEVILDIEILEVNRDRLLNLGVDFPDKIGVRAFNDLGLTANYTIDQIKKLNTNSLSLVAADPLATLNFKQTSNNTNLLANPRIRVKSKEQANFLIGDKVPVITTTTSQLSGSVSESISYLDVGLKLEVVPEVNKERKVQIAIKLEVSNIAKEVRSSTGLVAYQIGTRNASTVLQLQDGETQMLAGLIKDDTQSSATHLPGFGKIPLLGRLFSNTTDSKNKSEIVLLITPRIVRPYGLPASHIQEYISGTIDKVTTKPLRLSEQSNYQPKSIPNNELMPSNNQVEVKPPSSSDALAIANSNQNIPIISGDSDVKLQLTGPNTVAPGQEFTIALIQNTPALQMLSMEILHPSQMELVRTVLVAPALRVDQDKLANGTKLTLADIPAHQGPALLLTFKAPDTGLDGDQKIILNKVRVQSVGQPGKELNINESKTINITKQP